MSQGLVVPRGVGVSPDSTTGAPQSTPPPQSTSTFRPDPLFHAVLLGLSASVLFLAAVLSVRGSAQVVLPLLNLPLPELCMLKRYTGLSCPGCGLTRCFISLAHGDPASAWAYNPAGVFLFAIVVLQIPLRSYQIWRIRRGLPEFAFGKLAQIGLLIFVVALVGQWTMRLVGVTF